MPRYNNFDDVLDDRDMSDFELPEDREYDDRYDEDDEWADEEYERELDYDDSVSELTEWADYDPDC